MGERGDQDIQKLGKQNRIVCLIVDGEPYGNEKPGLGLEECFPRRLFVADENGDLTDTAAESIAADARPGKDGKANSLMKILSACSALASMKSSNAISPGKPACRHHGCQFPRARRRDDPTLHLGRTNRNVAVTAKNKAEERLYRSQVLQAANYAKEKNYSSATQALLDSERYRNLMGYLLKKVNPQLTVLEGFNKSIYPCLQPGRLHPSHRLGGCHRTDLGFQKWQTAPSSDTTT